MAKRKTLDGHSKPSMKYKMPKIQERKYYNLRSVLGNDKKNFIWLLGGRCAGKSYSVMRFFIHQYKHRGRPFTWMRLTEAQCKLLLANNAEKLVDADIRRYYNLDLIVSGDNVYEVSRDEKGKILEKKFMCRVLALSTFYADKGSGLYDNGFLKDPNMYYNICLDEMNKEKNERKTLDIIYSFSNQIENLVRLEHTRVRIICIGNLLEDCSDLLAGINFIPVEFGRYKLKKKKSIVEYIPQTEAMAKARKDSLASIITPDASTFTNQDKTDLSRIFTGKLNKPTCIIKFDNRDKGRWYCLWDSCIVHQYNGEKVNTVIEMAPYADGVFKPQLRDSVIKTHLARGYLFRNLITQKKFVKELELLAPSGK